MGYTRDLFTRPTKRFYQIRIVVNDISENSMRMYFSGIAGYNEFYRISARFVKLRKRFCAV